MRFLFELGDLSRLDSILREMRSCEGVFEALALQSDAPQRDEVVGLVALGAVLACQCQATLGVFACSVQIAHRQIDAGDGVKHAHFAVRQLVDFDVAQSGEGRLQCGVVVAE